MWTRDGLDSAMILETLEYPCVSVSLVQTFKLFIMNRPCRGNLAIDNTTCRLPRSRGSRLGWAPGARVGSGCIILALAPTACRICGLVIGVGISIPASRLSISSTGNVVGIEIRFRLKLDLGAGREALGDVRLQEVGYLLVGFQESPSQHTCHRFITVGEERSGNASMADATSAA